MGCRDKYNAYQMAYDIKRMLLQPYGQNQEGGATCKLERLYFKAQKSEFNRSVMVDPQTLTQLLLYILNEKEKKILSAAPLDIYEKED